MKKDHSCQWLISLWPRMETDEGLDLQTWKSWFIRVLMCISIFIFPFGMMATFPTLMAEHHYGLIFLDFFFWILVVYLFFFKPSSVQLNALIWLIILYVFTILFFIQLGPHHARSGWLVMCAVMAALFFGLRAAIFSVVCNAVILMMLYGLIDAGNPAWTSEFNAPFAKWLMFVINISMIALFTSVPVALLFRRLDSALNYERKARKALADEQKKLAESEEKYRHYIDNANDIITIIDINGHFTYVNPTASKLFGYSMEEAVDLHFTDLVRDDFKKNAGKFYTKQIAQKIPSTYYEFPAITKDGKEIWVGQKVQLVFENDRHVGFQVLGRDISERKMAEAALQDSKEKYQLLVENANDGIFIVQDGFIKFPNPKFSEITGYTEAEIAAKPFIELVHPADQERVLENYKKRMTGEKGVPFIYSLTGINKDGREISVEVNVVLILWEDRPASLNFIRDITHQKNMEAQLLQAQKMEAVGTLAGGIAHDFNNSLQAILGYTQILLIDTKEDAAELSLLKHIESAALRAKELIQQLLTYSRKVESKLAPAKLNHEVQRIERLLRRTIPRMVDIHLVLADNLHVINADTTQIEQILMNLCINARDAMPDGGKLTIETENVTLDEAYSRAHFGAKPGNYVLLSISDTGSGMDKETLEHIFEPFYTTKEREKGTGLGLAMVYGIVKSHGGYVMCYSEPGEGTIFKIYFPATHLMDSKHEEQKTKLEIRGGTETILLVDDDDSIREVTKNVLLRFGYIVLTASDGEEALEIYQENMDNIALIILDLIMPGMGGHKCFEEILKIAPHQSVIIASGYSANGQTKTALELGARAYLKKPFELDAMLLLVRDVLDQA